MSLTTYTRDELRDIILSHIRGRVTGANTARGSDYWHLATAIATVVHGDQAAAQHLVKQILPSTAEAKFVELHAYMRGLSRFPAAKWRGLVRVDASAEYRTIKAGDTLTAEDGTTYVVTRGATTRAAAWTGRTVAPGTTRSVVIVSPNAGTVSGEAPAVRDIFTTVVNGNAERGVIAELLPATSHPIAFVPYVPFDAAPTLLTAINVGGIIPIGCVIEVEAETAGAAGYVGPKGTLTLDDPPDDVTAAATVLEMGGGGDQETTDELRDRVLDFMAERPGGGNRSDYRQWARETPGVRLADAFVYPAYRGPGTVDLVPFGLAGARHAGELVRAMVQDYISGTAPTVGMASEQDDVLVRPLAEPSSQQIDVTITVHYEAGYEPDFGIVTLSPAVSQPSQSEVAITPATAMDQVEPGDRVLVPAGTNAPRLYERTVVGRTATALVLDEELPDFPSDTLATVSSGPLGGPVIAAIEALFDELGPGDTSPSTRFPRPLQTYGESITLASISSTIMGVEGVASVTVTAPSSDRHPATLTRLTLGQLQIRWLAAGVP